MYVWAAVSFYEKYVISGDRVAYVTDTYTQAHNRRHTYPSTSHASYGADSSSHKKTELVFVSIIYPVICQNIHNKSNVT